MFSCRELLLAIVATLSDTFRELKDSFDCIIVLRLRDCISCCCCWCCLTSRLAINPTKVLLQRRLHLAPGIRKPCYTKANVLQSSSKSLPRLRELRLIFKNQNIVALVTLQLQRFNTKSLDRNPRHLHSRPQLESSGHALLAVVQVGRDG